MTQARVGVAAEGSSSNPVRSQLISYFIDMGYDEDLVIKTIDQSAMENADDVLETLLAYTAVLGESPRDEPVPSYPDSPDVEWNSDDDNLSGYYSDSENYVPKEDLGSKMMCLMSMEFSVADIYAAIKSCDRDADVSELIDWIYASQFEERTLYHPCEPPLEGHGHDIKKKKLIGQGNRSVGFKKRRLSPDEDEEPKWIGFGVPGHLKPNFKRTLPEEALPSPYFYYENVAIAPKGTWSTISQCLFNIEPEFVDSRYFCAAARKRGYIHNLPTENRIPLLPIPPLTISEAFPYTSQWWPTWDGRRQLNCIRTSNGSARDTEFIKETLRGFQGDPPGLIQKVVLELCRDSNFIWLGKYKVDPLRPHEKEQLLGYPPNHTRGGGASSTERHKSLGNSFQVHTVAYHLSVLKDLFASGISVLSLFSGIGGAEIALHELGIPLRFVVAVESSEVNRNILRDWWKGTEQKGYLCDEITDVKDLTTEILENLIASTGGFDLVIGGSPCNNLSGSNRYHRDGLEGDQSVLFFEYVRILKTVQRLMRENKQH